MVSDDDERNAGTVVDYNKVMTHTTFLDSFHFWSFKLCSPLAHYQVPYTNKATTGAGFIVMTLQFCQSMWDKYERGLSFTTSSLLGTDNCTRLLPISVE